jgi:hypothetical protein
MPSVATRPAKAASAERPDAAPTPEMTDYPRTIDNGAGERLTFLGTRSDERGEYGEARNEVSPGSGPPMHVHYLQEESLTVERGTMGWQRPRFFDAAYLLSRYRSEFGMADIPAPVQRFVFPAVVAVGRLFGLHRRFADAPEPVIR